MEEKEEKTPGGTNEQPEVKPPQNLPVAGSVETDKPAGTSEEEVEKKEIPKVPKDEPISFEAFDKREEEKRKKGKTSSIRTYQSDIAEAVQSKKASLVTIAIAESKRKEKQKKAPPKKPATKKRLGKTTVLLVALLFVALGAGAVYFIFYYKNLTDDTSLTPDVELGSMIVVEKVLGLPTEGLDRTLLISEIRKITENTALSLGDVAEIIPTKSKLTGGEKKIDADELFEILNTNVDAAFARSMKDEFVLGVHNFGVNRTFLILKTSFFENAFAGMLRWENKIEEDLTFLMQEQRVESDTLPVTTTEFSVYEFKDIVVRNRDARALMDEAGNIKIIYSFPNRETLVVTNNKGTLVEVFERLTSARFK